MTADHNSATGPAPESKAKPRRKPANKQAADSKSTAGWNQRSAPAKKSLSTAFCTAQTPLSRFARLLTSSKTS